MGPHLDAESVRVKDVVAGFVRVAPSRLPLAVRVSSLVDVALCGEGAVQKRIRFGQGAAEKQTLGIMGASV